MSEGVLLMIILLRDVIIVVIMNLPIALGRPERLNLEIDETIGLFVMKVDHFVWLNGVKLPDWPGMY
jgi:hypothetical protein